MNTFGTPRHTHLRFLPPSEEDGEPVADPEAEPDAEDEQNAAHGRYVRLPGRDPIDLEAISDLSLD